ncbi:MAG: hypothetical protein IPM69_19085 [Ignavibacteria bacterium]|nr:hypothetical protein [Ignavibacteria bacterium]
MYSLRILLILLITFSSLQTAHAANPDILWQKTLTADTLPIRAIAIAEGKYVAALKGNQIIILDYATGDSVTAFQAPKEMYGNDIILGKGGERLYVLHSNGNLRSWDIATGVILKDVVMDATKFINSSRSYSQPNYIMDNSLDGKRIAVMTGYTFSSGPDYGSAQEVYIFHTTDSTNIKVNTARKQDEYDGVERSKSEIILSKSSDLNFSPSGNYLLNNLAYFYAYKLGGGGGKYEYSNSEYAFFSSFSKDLKTYQFKGKLPFYTISSGDDFLLSGNKLMDLPPTHSFRTLSKIGFVFCPMIITCLLLKQAAE